MPTIAYVLVFAAILLPATIYFWLAVREMRNIRSVADFFPLTRYLDANTYSHSTVASGVSLATVVLALVNLAPALGISLLVTVGSYVAGFIGLYFCAGRILRANPENKTIQAYLGNAYGSKTVQSVALIFNLIGYVTIFSMELLVGVTVLEPFLGNWVFAFSAAYLAFIIGYSLLSGYRAIVATEQVQLWFIVAAVAVLPLFLIILLMRHGSNVSLFQISAQVFSTWSAPSSFVLGIVAMNIPAAISDAATWQRLCSTRSVKDARDGIRHAIPYFTFLWGTLILVGCYISVVAISAGSFDPTKQSLMTFIITSLSGGGATGLVLLFVLILGLFAAMITTADSLLLVAAQMIVLDVAKVRPDHQPVLGIRTSRRMLVLIALLSFATFAVFHLIKFDVVQLVFAIYGSHLALFPAVAAALFWGHRLNLRRSSIAAWSSILVGFVASWGSAFYGRLGGNPIWLYNAPAVALAVSCVVFAVLLIPSLLIKPTRAEVSVAEKV